MLMHIYNSLIIGHKKQTRYIIMSISSNEQYQQFLEKIKSSSEFKNSERFQELFNYLMDETI